MRLRNLVPMAYVKDVRASIAFYAMLGLECVDTVMIDASDEIAWACLEAGDAALMLALASDAVVPSQQAILFYLYVDEVEAAHRQLVRAGLVVSQISYPIYCPDGEFRLIDPDGYCLMITHM